MHARDVLTRLATCSLEDAHAPGTTSGPHQEDQKSLPGGGSVCIVATAATSRQVTSTPTAQQSLEVFPEAPSRRLLRLALRSKQLHERAHVHLQAGSALAIEGAWGGNLDQKGSE